LESQTRLNITQAAKLAGVSRVTIYKHAKAGKISVYMEQDGSRTVDVAELERVYGTLHKPEVLTESVSTLQSETPQVMLILQDQIKRLEHELDRMRQERDVEREAREREREKSERERERLHSIIEKQTLLLPQPKETEGKRSWWRRWKGKS
jgi:hypothetical protein